MEELAVKINERIKLSNSSDEFHEQQFQNKSIKT
jgi:hypothetical protein